MKRATFIALWTLGLAIGMLIAGMLTFALLGFAGFSSWNQSTVVLVGRCWSVSMFGVPAVAFVLGLWGKLPGTKRGARHEA